MSCESSSIRALFLTSTNNEAGNRFAVTVLRTVALVAAVVGAVGSIVCVLRVGHRNKSIVLIAMFVIWDVAPFVGLLLAHRASRRWPSIAQSALSGVTLVVALASLAIYGVVALGPPRPTPASWFLIVPVASWLLIALVLRIARR